LLVFFLVLVVGLAALAFFASQWKKSVTVSKIVVGGTMLVSRQKIERQLKVFNGRKLVEVGIADIRNVLLPDPYIRDMRISKELNGIVRVDITERQPVAVTIYADKSMIIDSEGVLLPDNGISARYHRLPKVYGISRVQSAGAGLYGLGSGDHQLLDLILDAFDASPHARLMLGEIYLAGGNRTWFKVSGSPVRFIIGNDGNFKEKLKKFEIFWQKVVAKKGFECYEYVDLRFRERVFAREPETQVTQGAAMEPGAPAVQGETVSHGEPEKLDVFPK